MREVGVREESGGRREESGGRREERGGVREESGGRREERGGVREVGGREKTSHLCVEILTASMGVWLLLSSSVLFKKTTRPV